MVKSLDSKLKNLSQKELVVFDFDETLVDCNSDTWIYQLASNNQLPEQLDFKYGQDYFKHVQSVLNYLYDVHKVREKDYDDCLSKMPQVTGMFDILIDTLSKDPEKYDIIILSDSNSFFIDSYLKSKSYEHVFKAILTNSARFAEDGKLLVSEYHIQDYCNLSARNLCKGEALKNFIGKQMLDHNTVYTCVNYVGDGENDLCPSIKLSARDCVFPRTGFALSRLCVRLKRGGLAPDKSRLPELKARVVPWSSGDQILTAILSSSTSKEESS